MTAPGDFDPVALIGRRLANIVAKTANVVEIPEGLSEQEEALREALLALEARSSEGALAQLVVLAGLANCMETSTAPSEDQYHRRARQLARGLYSVRAVFEQMSGLDSDRLSGPYSMPRRLDPFRSELTDVAMAAE